MAAIQPTAAAVSALAKALDRAVPDPMAVEVYGDGIRIRLHGQRGFRFVEPWDSSATLEDFAREVLAAAQDEVSRR